MNNAFFEDRILSVSDVCKLLSDSLTEMFWGLNVEGEVCNFKVNSSKHWYFSIKDDKGSLLNCTCFASRNWNQEKPENGDLVVLSGSLSFWAKGGSLSFNVDKLRKKGAGDLRAEIEKRRAYYQELGYFDASNKKILPDEIRTIGVVTSETGAVIHDILNITRRRAKGMNILLFPCMVQGDGAEETIAARIRQANNFCACDVLIIARGGGSEEDLAPYSSSEVIEAIHKSDIVTISAVGHDSDYPLSDFVADIRASTPSAAAEIVTEKAYRSKERLFTLETGLEAAILKILNANRKKLESVSIDKETIIRKLLGAKSILKEAEGLNRVMRKKIPDHRMLIDRLEDEAETSLKEACKRRKSLISGLEQDMRQEMRIRLGKTCSFMEKLTLECNMGMKAIVRAKRKQLDVFCAEASALNPLAILCRGYSIVTDDQGRLIKSSRKIKAGQELTITFRDGKIKAETKEKSKEI